MTSKQRPEEAQLRGRAVWLARLPTGLEHDQIDHRDRRSQATELARTDRADIIGEFLVSSGEVANLPDHVWGEVLDFIRHVHADLLIVLRPDEISPAFSDYCRRTKMLVSAGIGLRVYAADGAHSETEEPSAA